MHAMQKYHLTLACCVLATCACSSGCISVAGIQDFNFSLANKARASSAWKEHFTPEQRRTLTSDFAAGFKKGYYDTAMNKDCRVPPVAPPKYWSARYQTCEGQCKVQDWFSGYQHGISAAQSGNCPSFAEVPVGPGAPSTNVSGCGGCYSADKCNCNPVVQPGQECSWDTLDHQVSPSAALGGATWSQSPGVLEPTSADSVISASADGLIGGYGSAADSP